MFGAIIGDIAGSVYEFANIDTKNFNLMNEKAFCTDDTIMTLAVAEILQRGAVRDRNRIISIIKRWGNAYPYAGYGGRFRNWLFGHNINPYNSFGNGAAMRVSACGWYGQTEGEVIDFARRVTEITHNHPEGLKGAEVTAMCVYYARIGKSKEFIKKYVEQYYPLNLNYEILKKEYCSFGSCQDTVPPAIYCFLISKDFEDCVRTTVSIGGDCDTTSAISCAIAEAYYKKIDHDLLDYAYDKLPSEKFGCDARKILFSFMQYRLEELEKREETTDL